MEKGKGMGNGVFQDSKLGKRIPKHILSTTPLNLVTTARKKLKK
jgi:hypothetical protein